MPYSTEQIKRFMAIADATTQEFRKGAEIVHNGRGLTDQEAKDFDFDNASGVVEVFAMPPASAIRDEPDIARVDVHFHVVAVSKKAAEKHRAEFAVLLDAYPEPERLAGGPSYIETGAVFGDQGLTFRLYALGEVLGFWKVITPATMGMSGALADELAGRGMVNITGYKKAA